MIKYNHRTGRLMTKVTKLLALLIILLLAGWSFLLLWDMYWFEKTNDAQIEQYVNSINTKVSGYIKEVYFQEHQKVRKSDTLYVIDDTEYRTDYEQAVAEKENTTQQVKVLENTIFALQNEAAAEQARIAGSKAKLDFRKKEYERYTQLLKEESVTKQQQESMLSELEMARSAYYAMLSNYQTALSKIAQAISQKHQAESEIRRREAIVERARLQVSYAVILAPYDGLMGSNQIQAGRLIQVGQPLTLIINEEAGKWVIANFKETQIGALTRKQKVRIKVDAFPNKLFNGQIESFSPATGARLAFIPPDNSTGNFVKLPQRIPIRIHFTDPSEKLACLRVGMNATVSVVK